ncbi:membrane protein insertase YidC [Xylophilus rhododendri]|uniref:Membrane protein insertase YidC n=1 Tax=Xylophilus rhododendri TaxID=2697032 RepID=A0A857J736_9BURK|nr:membrane protein insertase YidC [Xylophilus rhododendri]QHI98822.1 membrane protein insertase YidC [Xylophilus rhododendri]
MTDIRRTILWVIFGFSMVLLWDKWQIYNGHAPTFFPSTTSVATTPSPAAGKQEGASSVPTVASTPAASGAAVTAGGTVLPPAVTTTPSERIEVRTDVYRLVFDAAGGTLVQGDLLEHLDMEHHQQKFTLLEDNPTHVYVAQTGLIGGAFPTHKTVMTAVPGPRALADGQNTLQVRFESPEVGGVKLVKTYTLTRGSYAIDVKQEVQNVGAAPVSPQLYLQLVRDGNTEAQKIPAPKALQFFGMDHMPSFYSTFTGPAIYTTEKKYQKVDFKKIEENKVDIEKQSDTGYVAMVQHYFATAWLLGNGIQRDLFMRKVDNNLYAVGMITSLGQLAPGASKTVDATLFAGPQDENKLEALMPGLELVKDYGWLTILAKPLYWLLDKLHGFLHNWGWSIVALVVLLKAAFFWLNAKAYASMAKMKALNPKIQAMRERLKDKPQEMQKEMMRIYREEKVNPMGGCFPIVIQIPVFISLYWVLLSSVEMRGAPWILWITDLSTPDPYFIMPLLMTLTSLLQTALNPTPPDPVQARLMWIMPLAFSVMFFFFPAGLVLYWLTNNILSITQQYVINKRLGVTK